MCAYMIFEVERWDKWHLEVDVSFAGLWQGCSNFCLWTCVKPMARREAQLLICEPSAHQSYLLLNTPEDPELFQLAEEFDAAEDIMVYKASLPQHIQCLQIGRRIPVTSASPSLALESGL